MGVDDGHVAVARKRDLPSQAGDGDGSQGVLIGAAVDGLALDLFGGDVFERAHEATGPGQARLRARRPRQAEVGQIGMVRAIDALARGDEHVGWLDVAMDEPRLMRRVER